jgi:hypothetical protein
MIYKRVEKMYVWKIILNIFDYERVLQLSKFMLNMNHTYIFTSANATWYIINILTEIMNASSVGDKS